MPRLRGRKPPPGRSIRIKDFVNIQAVGGGVKAAEVAELGKGDRIHLVKVIYLHSRTGAWVHRDRIL